MVSWIALVISLLAWLTASTALCIGVWIYFKGPKIAELDIDDLYDALLEQNDSNVLFKEEPLEED